MGVDIGTMCAFLLEAIYCFRIQRKESECYRGLNYCFASTMCDVLQQVVIVVYRYL